MTKSDEVAYMMISIPESFPFFSASHAPTHSFLKSLPLTFHHDIFDILGAHAFHIVHHCTHPYYYYLTQYIHSFYPFSYAFVFYSFKYLFTGDLSPIIVELYFTEHTLLF